MSNLSYIKRVIMLVLPTDWSPRNTSLYFARGDTVAISSPSSFFYLSIYIRSVSSDIYLIFLPETTVEKNATKLRRSDGRMMLRFIWRRETLLREWKKPPTRMGWCGSVKLSFFCWLTFMSSLEDPPTRLQLGHRPTDLHWSQCPPLSFMVLLSVFTSVGPNK